MQIEFKEDKDQPGVWATIEKRIQQSQEVKGDLIFSKYKNPVQKIKNEKKENSQIKQNK